MRAGPRRLRQTVPGRDRPEGVDEVSIAPKLPATNIPLPTGAVFVDVWEDAHRALFGAARVAGHLVVEATALQRDDGTIAGETTNAPSMHNTVVRDGAGSVITVYLGQVPGLIAELTAGAGDLERWRDQAANAGDHTANPTRYTLAEATQLLLGDNHGMRDPYLWVARRLRSGKFSGQKIGRQWFMQPADIEAALEAITSKPKPQPAPEPEPLPRPLTVINGLSARSRNRVLRNADA
jgi:hypothetical protein